MTKHHPGCVTSSFDSYSAFHSNYRKNSRPNAHKNAVRQIPSWEGNSRFHYSAHKSPSQNPILSQSISIHATSRTKRWNQCQYWILAAVSRCCSWCTALNWYACNFSCFFTRWTLVTDKHFLCSEILSRVGELLSYSVLLIRIRVAKCFMNDFDALLSASRTAANDFDAK
jgi:hypothetical protein